MTDKQIIFGVDVSKCPYAEPAYGSPKCRINGYVHCDGFRNCEYKQLKRKKQRIVELNKTIKAKEQECERLKNERTVDLVKQLDQLKSENEKLQSNVKSALVTVEVITKSNIKLRETLAEIKDIALKACECCGECQTEFSQKDWCDFKEILQKISECEV